MGVITSIRRNVKNTGRCSVFVDDEFLAACPIDVAASLGLRKGLEMTPELEHRLRQEDRRMVLRQKAYRYATYKPRTAKQVRDQLATLEATEEESDDVMVWLAEFRLVDDEEYARRFIAASQERKPLSPSDTRRKLRMKGVPEEVVERMIEEAFDDDVVVEAARRVAEKKVRMLKGDRPERKRKLTQFLQYRGYTWPVVKRVIEDMSDLLSILVALTLVGTTAAAQGTLSCDKTRLPDAINAYQPTTQPVLAPDGRLFLDRKLHPDNRDGITDPDDVWIAERRSAIAWAEPIQAAFTSVPRPDVVFNFTPDGLHALVVGRYQQTSSADTVSAFAILSRRSLQQPFDEVELLPIKDLGTNYYGFLTADRTAVLLALQRPGGAGDLDLYVTTTCYEGWSELRALGSTINSAGLEGSPWLAQDGRTLYFVSNGRDDRLGKSDVYITRRLDSSWTQWSKPVDLGSCVNSQDDEASISLDPTEATAYLTSWDPDAARPGVYSVTVPVEHRPDPVCWYRAEVVDAITDEPLRNYRITIVDSAAGSAPCGVYVHHSDTSSGRALICIPEGRSYRIETDVLGYTRHRQAITVRDLDSSVDLTTTVRLFALDRPLASLFFDRGSAQISDSAATVLREVVARYRDLKVKLYVDGYTDRVGGDESNAALSLERAKAVSMQLILSGMDPQRVLVAGKGIERVPGVFDEEYPQSRRVDIFARSED